MENQKNIAVNLLSENSFVSTKELTAAGVHKETIRRLIINGEIIKAARGLYISSQFIPDENYSFLLAQKIVKKGVICLLSALSFHGIGTQNPSEVWIAISRQSRCSPYRKCSIKIITFSGISFDEGVEKYKIGSDEINVYCLSKTIADCFKYRNKIGLDVAIEALKDIIQNKRAAIDDIIKYAEICWVKRLCGLILKV